MLSLRIYLLFYTIDYISLLLMLHVCTRLHKRIGINHSAGE